uniref:Putative myosin class ii heavy chain n=1 Tax=Panstrongylus megistus TaxID=65343 RepID=A0A069DZE9_9HEMI
MEKYSKKELQDTVVKQQSELARYKSRLADLVAAHKCLLKEKEILESSLKSISQSKSKKSEDETSTSSQDTNSSTIEKAEVESCSDQASEEVKDQLSTLMNSLATLSEEKSRMEAAFQADKKQLRAEKLQMENTIKELQQQLEHETRAHLSEMENFKSKLIVERHQREMEHNDHGVMIRELQKVVSEERSKREKAEGSTENLKSELHSTHYSLQQAKKESSDLKAQIEELKENLKFNNQSSGATALKLQQELSELKKQHIQSSIKEQEKIQEAEEKSRRLAAAHEERVVNLEARVAELSQTIGIYDRLRQSDQIAIDKLKERLLQLEMEHGEEKSDSNVDDLISKLRHIKNLIDTTNLTSEKPVDIKALWNEIIQDNCNAKELHKQCLEEFEQLKEQFESYKKQVEFAQRPNSPSFRVENNNREQELCGQIKKLKERICNLHNQIDELEKSHKKELDNHSQVLMAEKVRYKERLAAVEAEWRSHVLTLETQMAKQRERALNLVKEKDEEIAELKDSLNTLIPKQFSADKIGNDGEGVVLHYSEEVARRDVELSRLRKIKLQLEADLRDIGREMSQLASHDQHLSSLLKHQLQRFEQCQSREGANLEYLKNVVLSFLLSTDSGSKGHMLNAIAAVLKFTDAEKSKITQSSWWYKPSN